MGRTSGRRRAGGKRQRNFQLLDSEEHSSRISSQSEPQYIAPKLASYQKNISPKSPEQERLIDALSHPGVVLATGPAGTGKTYLAISKAVEALDQGRVDKLVLCRPAIEAGESLGFLPGNIEAKLSPYLRPMYDVLTERMGGSRLRQLLLEGIVEIAPIGYLRGRTFNNSFIVVDEAQNCSYAQLKMLVTRYGWHTTMVLTGDPDQSDLLPGISGLSELVSRLEPVEQIKAVKLGHCDVVRHPLVARILSTL